MRKRITAFDLPPPPFSPTAFFFFLFPGPDCALERNEEEGGKGKGGGRGGERAPDQYVSTLSCLLWPCELKLMHPD